MIDLCLLLDSMHLLFRDHEHQVVYTRKLDAFVEVGELHSSGAIRVTAIRSRSWALFNVDLCKCQFTSRVHVER
jgi:hypothetical protein